MNQELQYVITANANGSLVYRMNGGWTSVFGRAMRFDKDSAYYELNRLKARHPDDWSFRIVEIYKT